MQVPQEDSNNCKRVGVEEHLIKFRPSPNFKNMKKFIKSRSVTTDTGSPIMESSESSPLPNMGRNPKLSADVQPPLPLDPPPPDNLLNYEVKKEIEDLEYENDKEFAPEQETCVIEVRSPEQLNEQRSEICRDFIRGTCKRQGTCKFAHKYDLSQLEGVYTFCRKFQNSICTFTNCKYVHASVFQERHFYRTGILPPHALAHHKANVLQPPPPPPPEEPQASVALPFNIDFSNPPPQIQTEIDKAEVATPCTPTSSGSVGTGFMEEVRNQIPPKSISPLKRGWDSKDSFPAAPCDHAYNEHLPKKCKNCDITEFRLQYNKDKVDKMIQSKEELNKKMTALEKKSEKLLTIILALLKPSISSKVQNHSNGMNGDKDKSLLDQLSSILSASRMSSHGDEK